MSDAAEAFPSTPLNRPIRVVLFCGPVLERGMIRFARLLHEHPEVEFLGGFCQSPGLGLSARVRDLVRRRGVVAVPLAVVQGSTALGRWLAHPGAERLHRRCASWLAGRLHVTEDIHAEPVLDRVRALDADLGVIYGGPILRPELFTLPRWGTLGIHHGKLPEYRGKKTTFWSLYNGELTAGVTIQKVNAGVDTGQAVRTAEVPARGRSYRRVEAELEELGLDRYLDAVLAVKRGTATARPIEGKKRRLYRDPSLADLARFAAMRWTRRKTSPGPAAPASVMLLTESYHPMTGGGETQTRALASALSAVGVPVRVVTRRWNPLQPALAQVDGSWVQRVGPTGAGHLKKWGLAATALPAIVAHRRSHRVLLVSGLRVLGIPATLAARRLGLRVILKADSVGEMSGAFFDPGLARFGLSHRSAVVRAGLALRNRLLRRADAFVAISSAIADEFVRHGVPRSRIHTVPNGVDSAVFRPPHPGEKPELRARLGLPAEDTLLIYTGRLVSYKGLPELLRAWAAVTARRLGATLVLVGEGGADIHNCEADLREFVRRHDLAERVRFTGAVENVADYLRASDLFVFPSQDEAFGLSVVEAMACGLPVIATRVGGLADFVEEANGAVAVPDRDEAALADAISRLLDDPETAESLGRRGRETVCARYTLEAIRDRYLELVGLPGGVAAGVGA